MKTFGLRASTWLRIGINAGFVLVLLGVLLARATTMPLEQQGFKALQQTLCEIPFASDSLGGDPPDTKNALQSAALLVAVASAPQVLGQSPRQPFHSMVHQLRDRLMHAPPSYL